VQIGEFLITIPDVSAFVIYTIMIVVLIARPQGLFSRGGAR
jgi:branched-subunit amino acid ABC-type transport system permease component